MTGQGLARFRDDEGGVSPKRRRGRAGERPAMQGGGRHGGERDEAEPQKGQGGPDS